MPSMGIPEDQLQGLYTWVDEIPLSRPKRNIARDFSDGVLLAEIMYHYYPKYVELHNYSAANSLSQKMYNWNTLNQRVFKRLHFQIPKSECENVCNSVPGAVEKVLLTVKGKIAAQRSKPKASQRKGYGGHQPPVSPKYTDPNHRAYEYQQEAHQQVQSVHVAAGPPSHQMPHGMQHPHHMHYQQYQPPAQDMGAIQRAMAEKDATINELQETSEILDTKVRKLEQLVRLKDAKIQTLLAKLQGAGLA